MAREHIQDHQQKWEKTKDFVRAVVNEETDELIPQYDKRKHNLRSWQRMRYIVGTYVFHESATLRTLGREFGISTQAVQSLKERGFEWLYKNSSPEVKARFPLAELTFIRPMTIATKERKSQMSTGVLLGIRLAIDYGATSYQQLKALGFTRDQIADARKTYGEIVPKYSTR
jgi:hypothetical protein